MYVSPQLKRLRNTQKEAKKIEKQNCKSNLYKKRKRNNVPMLSSSMQQEEPMKKSRKRDNVPRLSSSIQQEEPMKNAINFLKKSQNENKSHSANICVICDRFIKGI